MYIIYMWLNKINSKKYIGTTNTTLLKRAGKQGSNYRGSPRFYDAIKRYGFLNFRGIILLEGLTRLQAHMLLKLYILKYLTLDRSKGYNLHLGGLYRHQSIDHLNRVMKISNTLKKQRSSPLYRKLMSERMTKVWNNLLKRRSILLNRKGKPTGRPLIAVFCMLRNKTYKNMHEASKDLGISVSGISLAFKNKGDICTVKSKTKDKYTLKKIVHVKEGELLEA